MKLCLLFVVFTYSLLIMMRSTSSESPGRHDPKFQFFNKICPVNKLFTMTGIGPVGEQRIKEEFFFYMRDLL